jgi:dihydropteroate synthase
VAADAIIVDPGIGFGKTVQHNLELMRRLREFKDALGYPVLMGVSRKSTIGTVLGGLPPDDRLEGTAAAVALSIANGADIVRVHDVQAMARVARMTDAIVRGWTHSSS